MEPRLICAVLEGDADEVYSALLAGDSPNTTFRAGSVLGIAIGKHDARVVGSLLAFGADPNYIDVSGQTPLLRAVDASLDHREQLNLVEDDPSVVRLLLEHGADQSVRSGLRMETPLEHANHYPDSATARLLSSWPPRKQVT